MLSGWCREFIFAFWLSTQGLLSSCELLLVRFCLYLGPWVLFIWTWTVVVLSVAFRLRAQLFLQIWRFLFRSSGALGFGIFHLFRLDSLGVRISFGARQSWKFCVVVVLRCLSTISSLECRDLCSAFAECLGLLLAVTLGPFVAFKAEENEQPSSWGRAELC